MGLACVLSWRATRRQSTWGAPEHSGNLSLREIADFVDERTGTLADQVAVNAKHLRDAINTALEEHSAAQDRAAVSGNDAWRLVTELENWFGSQLLFDLGSSERPCQVNSRRTPRPTETTDSRCVFGDTTTNPERSVFSTSPAGQIECISHPNCVSPSVYRSTTAPLTITCAFSAARASISACWVRRRRKACLSTRTQRFQNSRRVPIGSCRLARKLWQFVKPPPPPYPS